LKSSRQRDLEPDRIERVARVDPARRRSGRILACARLSTALLWMLCGCGSKLDLGSNDAGATYDADCRPGTYAGTYACSEAGGSLLLFPPNGPVVIRLVPIGASTLALPPDASLLSTTAGATFISTVTGVLDCSTRMLTGAVPRVALSSPTIKTTIDGNGQFSAIYDPDASPPALVDGVFGPPQLTSTCSWTAQLQ
jgi:hypothetical protein